MHTFITSYPVFWSQYKILNLNSTTTLLSLKDLLLHSLESLTFKMYLPIYSGKIISKKLKINNILKKKKYLPYFKQ